jgi:hypothetical protein
MQNSIYVRHDRRHYTQKAGICVGFFCTLLSTTNKYHYVLLRVSVITLSIFFAWENKNRFFLPIPPFLLRSLCPSPLIQIIQSSTVQTEIETRVHVAYFRATYSLL